MTADALATAAAARVPPEPDAGFTLTSRPESVAVLLRRLWRSRDLVSVLARREFFARFKRATFGTLWAVALPAFQAAVLVVVFSHIVKIHTDVPYVTFVFAGMAVWTFFSPAVTSASTAIVDGRGLSSKIYFPRAVLPLVSVGAYLYGLIISLALLFVVDAADTRHVGVEILLLIPGAALLVLLITGIGLVNSAVHVYFRDLRFIIQAALVAWIYLTPIFYPMTLVGGLPRVVILTNPVTGVVEVFRAATVGADTELLLAVGISVAWTLALLGFALLLHARLDRRFTDLL